MKNQRGGGGRTGPESAATEIKEKVGKETNDATHGSPAIAGGGVIRQEKRWMGQD